MNRIQKIHKASQERVQKAFLDNRIFDREDKIRIINNFVEDLNFVLNPDAIKQMLFDMATMINSDSFFAVRNDVNKGTARKYKDLFVKYLSEKFKPF
jgi:hypothetical protein